MRIGIVVNCCGSRTTEFTGTTGYLSPIGTLPEGLIEFPRTSAVTTSSGDIAYDCSRCGSSVTTIDRALPPNGGGADTPGKVENIGHHTIFLPDDYKAAFDDLCKNRKVPAGLPFYISIASETDPDLAPAGDSTVFVLVPTPLLSELPWLDVAEIRRQVLTRIGLDETRIVVEHVWTPEEWKRRFGLFDGSAFGAAHTLFQVGPFRSRNYSRDVQGLYYTGAGTTPGTGMPMVILSGKMTAERIASHAV